MAEALFGQLEVWMEWR